MLDDATDAYISTAYEYIRDVCTSAHTVAAVGAPTSS
jgi:hypothetical protein